VNFTAKMEEELDLVASGDNKYREVLDDFYIPFSKALIEVEKNIEKVKCEKCGSDMDIKIGRFGKFLACNNYPKCKTTKPYLDKIGVKCPGCSEGDVVVKKAKGRTFYGCSRYSDCDWSSWKRPDEDDSSDESDEGSVEGDKDSNKDEK
jgi:DNA topoisomerase-1